jgi:CheY-like chemotaxis protein
MRSLIVDDETANVALLEDILGEQGYSPIKSTTDSRRVLELCDEFDPDLFCSICSYHTLRGLRFSNPACRAE